jgi:putative oxidoreductase
MRLVTTGARLVLGSYLAVHGAQKLFGAFGGAGLDATGKGFESIGLTPGREMAMLAGVAELGGGLLTVTAVAEPLGPVTIAATMAVASAVHRKAGPLASKGGYELPLTNLALAAVLAAGAHRTVRLGPRLPRRIAVLTGVGAAVFAGISVAQLLRPAEPPAASPAPPPDAPTPALDAENAE